MHTVSKNILFLVLWLLNHVNAQENDDKDTKIVGGVEAIKHEFPWIVNVQTSVGFCGGSIIDKDWVLTAAHCVSTGGYADITAGDHNLYNCDRGEQKVSSCQIIQHGNYYEDIYGVPHNDIALIKLSKSFEFSDSVKAIPLPTVTTTVSGVTTLAGWGTLNSGGSQPSPVLMKVDVNTVSQALCQNQYAGINITNEMVCAASPGKDSCQGDSGGPLMCKPGTSNFAVCGIVSFGNGCADPRYSGVYTKVSSYLNWISTTITSSRNCTSPGSLTYCNSQIIISPSIYLYLISITYFVLCH